MKRSPDNYDVSMELLRRWSDFDILGFAWWLQISLTSAALSFIGNISWRGWGNFLCPSKSGLPYVNRTCPGLPRY